jgi:hypothetical protein
MSTGHRGRIDHGAHGQSLTDFMRNDPGYSAAALDRDRWFALLTLGTVLTLLTTSMGILFGFPLVVVVIPAAFMLYSMARWAVRQQRAAKMLRPWIEANPYHGPAPRIVGPLRGLALHQPTIVGLAIAAVLFGLILLATFGRHHT